MSVTSGFFNSLNHDRRYNAQQFSALFDGIINDGVFANIGVAFAIKADTGVTITIGKGKAWFNSAWVYNDSLLPKTLEGSEVVLDRIDAVVIEVDHSEAVRLGDIKIVKGTPSSSPQRPAMTNTANKHQHPLAYIYRKAGSTVITQADITNMVGTSSCPYITGILQVQNIDNIVAQWEAQWNQWYAEKVSDTNSDSSELLADMKSDFDIWFADVKALLDDDVATELAGKVAELQGKFDDLAREGAVYDTLEDSDLEVILGSDGTPIQGRTVLGGAGVGPIDADTLQGRKAEDFRSADWLPTIEEIGAAPAGYGFGGTAINLGTVTTEEALNTILDNAHKAMSDGEVKQIRFYAKHLANYEWYGTISRLNSNYCTVVATTSGIAATIYKYRNDSGWNPVEWENPLLYANAEYRTTERCNGEIVYAKRVEYTAPGEGIGSTSAATDVEIAHGISNYRYLVRCTARSGAYPLPAMSSNGGSVSVTRITGTNIIIRLYKDEWSGSIFFDLYYVKSPS